MPSHILVNGLGLTYKGTVGISTATIPDVCKTPTPAGPVPIPYPNIATQSSLQKGTKTVQAKGKMIAVKGSQYGRSNGDEAGTAGGVKSGVNMKATDWITYSFDVKMDGKNVCRHTDKKFHNNQNTVDLAGNSDPLSPAQKKRIREKCKFDIDISCGSLNDPDSIKKLKTILEEIAEECNKCVNKEADHCKPENPTAPSGKRCTYLGTSKHKCCEDTINKQKNGKKKKELECIEAEKRYKKDEDGEYKPCEVCEGPSPREQAAAEYENEIRNQIEKHNKNRAEAVRYVRDGKVFMNTYQKAGGGDFVADVVIFGPPPKSKPIKAFDFKFNCKAKGFMTSDQKEKYHEATGLSPEIIHQDGRKC